MAKIISVREAAARLGVSRQTMINWGESGVIKIRKMGKTGNAYWVDAATIDALTDAVSDVEHAKQMLAHEQEEIRNLYKEERDILKDLRREVFMLKKFGEGIIVRDFYQSIPVMLQKLDVLTSRESAIMQHVIGGDDMGWIGERFGLTRARISQIFFKGCRKAKELEHLKATVDRAEKDQLELDYLRKKVKQDADRIKTLEEKLNIKNNTQEEQERDLLMMRLIDYNFTVRTLNCLRAADIETVGDLVQVRRSALLKFRNFGRKSMKELDDFLESIGKSWGNRDVHRGAHGEIYWTD